MPVRCHNVRKMALQNHKNHPQIQHMKWLETDAHAQIKCLWLSLTSATDLVKSRIDEIQSCCLERERERERDRDRDRDSPCIETVDVRSKLVISGLRSSSRVVEWGRDAVWAQPCLTSTSTSWQKLWTAPATSRASLCTTLKSNACCMRTTWFWCPPQPRVSSTAWPCWNSTVRNGLWRSTWTKPESWCSRRRPGLREADTSSVTEEKFWSTASATLTWASRSLHRGGFSLAVKALYEKAWRAFYAIKSRFGQLKLPIKTWDKLYHAIIKQILLYGSEIWGPVIHFQNWDKTSIEKLQLEMIKNILGVHRSTSNDACRAELGFYPLKIEIQKRCVQFWHHLHQSDPDSVQYKALLANETSAESHPLNTLAHQLVHKTQLLTDYSFKPKAIIKDIDTNLKYLKTNNELKMK